LRKLHAHRNRRPAPEYVNSFVVLLALAVDWASGWRDSSLRSEIHGCETPGGYETDVRLKATRAV